MKIAEKFNMSQEKFNACDTAIKIISIAGLILSGIFALNQYQDSKEKDYKKSFYDKQLNVIESLYQVMYEMDTYTTKKEKDKALKKFWMIYHVSGRTFLSPKLYEKLNIMPIDYVTACIAKISKPKYIEDCDGFSSSVVMADFGKAARNELSIMWKQDLVKIGSEDPWLPSHLQNN
ncbi:hypothetical protein GL58_07225 [Comamonas testosteroni]|uniref:Uncharacterized protein n=2 Tax=Comamonas testosteroni TaxID=285 RepID=A0A0L7MK25_COMTE|nr:hypothetical protein GL58_07225 [Comamonas testosteroni]